MDFSDGKSPAKIVSNAGVRFVGISHLARNEGNILSGFVRGSIITVSPTKDLLEPATYSAIMENKSLIAIIASVIEIQFEDGKSHFGLDPDLSKRYIGNGRNGLVVRYLELRGGRNRNRSFAVKYTDEGEWRAIKLIAGVSCMQVPSHALSWDQMFPVLGFVRGGYRDRFVTMSPPILGGRSYVALAMPIYDGDLWSISEHIIHGRLTVSPYEELNLINLVREGLECMYKEKLCYADLKPTNIFFKRDATDQNLIGISIGDMGSDRISSFLNPFVKYQANAVELCAGSTRAQALDFLLVMFATSMFNIELHLYISDMIPIITSQLADKVTRDTMLSLAQSAIVRHMPHFSELTRSWVVA